MTEPTYDYTPLTSDVSPQELRSYRTTHGLQYVTPNSDTLAGVLGVLIAAYVLAFIISVVALGVSFVIGGMVTTIILLGAFGGILLQRIRLIRREVRKTIRLQRFADANHLSYVSVDNNPAESGSMFSSAGFASPGQLADIMSDSDNADSASFKLATYEYGKDVIKTRAGRLFTYLKLDLHANLPQIVLDGQKNNSHLFGTNVSNIPAHFKEAQQQHLEGDFDSYFRLYAPKGYERDALYVFTPDLMELLIDNAATYDAEIVDHYLYVYMGRIDYSKPETMQRIFSIAETVGAKAVSQTEFYHDDVAPELPNGAHEVAGRRLKQRLTVVQIIVLCIVGFFFVLVGIGILIGVGEYIYEGFTGTTSP